MIWKTLSSVTVMFSCTFVILMEKLFSIKSGCKKAWLGGEDSVVGAWEVQWVRWTLGNVYFVEH